MIDMVYGGVEDARVLGPFKQYFHYTGWQYGNT